jgi:hypothetical protein
MNRNYLDDLRVGCKSSFSLIKLIGIDADLEEQLKQFEKAFEKDEVMDI